MPWFIEKNMPYALKIDGIIAELSTITKKKDMNKKSEDAKNGHKDLLYIVKRFVILLCSRIILKNLLLPRPSKLKVSLN